MIEDFIVRYRRQFRKNFKPTPKKAVRELLMWRDFGRCVYCGRSVKDENWHADHITAYSRGGRSHVDNLAVSCAPCNMSKSYHAWDQKFPASFWRRVVAVVIYVQHVRLVDLI